MYCHLVGGKPLPNPVLTSHQLDPQQQISAKLELKKQAIFIHENAFESIVHRMWNIISGPQ